MPLTFGLLITFEADELDPIEFTFEAIESNDACWQGIEWHAANAEHYSPIRRIEVRQKKFSRLDSGLPDWAGEPMAIVGRSHHTYGSVTG